MAIAVVSSMRGGSSSASFFGSGFTAPTAGQLEIVMAIVPAATTITAPAGETWNTAVNVTPNRRLATFWRIVPASPTNGTFTMSTSAVSYFQALITGHDTTTPIAAAQAQGSATASTSITSPTLTSTASASLRIDMYAQPTTGTPTITQPAGQTQLQTLSTASGYTSTWASETVGAGATGTRTATSTLSAAPQGMGVVVTPASASTVPVGIATGTWRFTGPKPPRIAYLRRYYDTTATKAAITAATSVAELTAAFTAMGAVYGFDVTVNTTGGALRSNYTSQPMTFSDPNLKPSALTLAEELSKYPPEFIQAAGLSRYTFVKTLVDSTSPRDFGGYTFADDGYCVIDIDGTEVITSSASDDGNRGLTVLVHHELGHNYHFRGWPSVLGSATWINQWEANNPSGWSYSSTWATDPYTGEHPVGFIRNYGRSAYIEDFTDTAAHVFMTHMYSKVQQWTSEDPGLAGKIQMWRNHLASISVRMGSDNFFRAIHDQPILPEAIPSEQFVPVVEDSSFNAVTAGTSLTVTLPDRPSGELQLATVMHRSALTTPSGWTLLYTYGPATGTTNNQRQSVLWRRAPGGTSSLTLTQASSVRLQSIVLSLSNALDPVARVGSRAESFTGNDPVLTTSKDANGLFLWVADSTIWASAAGQPWVVSPLEVDVYSTSEAAPRLAVFGDPFPQGARSFRANTGGVEVEHAAVTAVLVAPAVQAVPQGSATGTLTWIGVATGVTGRRGTSSGSWSFAGVASGARTPKATAAGTFTFAGVAAGKRSPRGVATGTLTFTGSAAGTRAPKATGAGAWSFTGTTAGERAPKAGATGAWSFVGSATGKHAPSATGVGSWAFTGAATGAAPVVGGKTGTATGVWSYAGTAAGSRAARGTAAGAWSFSGTTAGQTTRSGTASGSLAWTGQAVGTAPAVGGRSGAGVGAWSFTGNATGARTASGTATGLLSWTGQAAGLRPVVGAKVGTASGSWAFTGVASGARAARGAGTGAWAYTGTAAGSSTRRGTGTGLLTWAGVATGVSPIVGGKAGTASGSWAFTGEATGRVTRRGTATGAVAYTGTASGAKPTFGTATGTSTWIGTAIGRKTVAGRAVGTITFAGAASGATHRTGAAVGTWTYTGFATSYVGPVRDITVAIGNLTRPALSIGKPSRAALTIRGPLRATLTIGPKE